MKWKWIPGFAGYQASSNGHIRSWRVRGSHNPAARACRPTLRKSHKNKRDGYWYARLRQDGRWRTITVARAVCLAWWGRPPDDSWQASHLDGNPDNNHYTNLRWEPCRQNNLRKYAHGWTPGRDETGRFNGDGGARTGRRRTYE